MDTHTQHDHNNPINFNGKESERCKLCDNELINEETQEEEGYCFDCFYSCCGDELDQDDRKCPTCGEHN